MSKIGKKGDISISLQEKSHNYYTKRLTDLGLTEQDLQVLLPDGSTSLLFEDAKGKRGNAIQFNYLTDQGGKETYKKKGSRFVNNFKRYRLLEARGTQKYTQEAGTGQAPYLSSLYQSYWSKGTYTPDLIATEGEFKSIALNKAGHPSFAVPGIFGFGKSRKHEITNKTVDVTLLESLELAVKERNVKSVTFLLDADPRLTPEQIAKGETLADWYSKSCSSFLLAFKHIDTVTPRIAFQKNVLVNGEHPKGVDDLIQCAKGTPIEVHVTEALELLSRGESSHFFEVLHPALEETHRDKVRLVNEYLGVNKKPLTPPVEYTTLEVERYLGEKVGELHHLINTRKNICISAPTGSGKTTAILNEMIPGLIIPENPNACCTFLAPTNTIVDNQYNANEKAGRENKGTALDPTQDVPLLRIDGTVNPNQLVPLNSYAPGVPNTVLSTYDGLQKIERQIDYTFIDESHRLPADASFRRKALVEVERHLFGDKKNEKGARVLMSAQPSPFFKYFGFEFVEVAPKNVKVKDLVVKEYTSSTANVIGQLTNVIAGKIKDDPTKLFSIRVQSKTTLEVVQRTLIKLGLTKEQVLIVTSDTKKDAQVQLMLEEQRLPDGVNVLLSTSVIDEGINIKNKAFEGVYFFADKNEGALDPIPAIQYPNRFREIEGNSCEFVVFVKSDARTGENFIHPDELIQKKLRQAKHFAEVLNLNESLGSHEESNSLLSPSLRNLVYFCERSRAWKPFTLGIIHECELYFNQRRSPAQFVEALKADRTLNVRVEEFYLTRVSNAYAETVKEIKQENSSWNELLSTALLINPVEVVKLFYPRIEEDKRKFIQRALPSFVSHSTLEYSKPLPVALPTLSALSNRVKLKFDSIIKEILELYDLGEAPGKAVKIVVGLRKARKGSLLEVAKASKIMDKQETDDTGKYNATATQKALVNVSKANVTLTLAYHNLYSRLIEIAHNSNPYYKRYLSERELITLIQGKAFGGNEYRKHLGALSYQQIKLGLFWFCDVDERRTGKGRTYRITRVLYRDEAYNTWVKIANVSCSQILTDNTVIQASNSYPSDNICTPPTQQRKKFVSSS